jgi:hypothetical protein
VGVDAVRTGICTWRRIPFVYGICPRYGLCVGFINSFPVYEALIVETRKTGRANFGTVSTSRTFVKIDVSRTFIQGNFKIAGLAGYFFDFRYGVKLYVDVPADLDQFG